MVIINQTMAKQFWPGEEPIGQRITFDLVPDEQPREIVGIVGDTLLGRFQQQAPPIIYVPHLQQQDTCNCIAQLWFPKRRQSNSPRTQR